MVWGFFYCCRNDGLESATRQCAGGSCGSIARSETEKFTFMDATMVRGCPAVGAKHKHYDESHSVFVLL